MHHWLWDDHVHQVLWINMDIHHSKHVYNQSNPSGTPLKTFQAHIPRVDFQQFWHFAFNSQTPLPKVIPSVPERSFPNPKHRLGSSKTLLPIDNVSNNLTYSHCASLSFPSSSLSSLGHGRPSAGNGLAGSSGGDQFGRKKLLIFHY